MRIQTTCIGAYPKPDYITTGNWSETTEQERDSRSFTYTNDDAANNPVELLDRATGS